MSHNKQLQEYIEEYQRLQGSGFLRLPDIGIWLLREKRWHPSREESLKLLCRHLSAAMRTQFTTDPDGRRVRRKHAVRYKETLADGTKQQTTFWYDKDFAPPHFMQTSFAQRREGIADDCWQLKQDVDSYNKFNNNAAHIQVVFQFEEDMEERELSRDYPPPEDDGDRDDL